jgi:hypothetical protein
MSEAIVFLGPTLAWAEARGVLAAQYLPPVSRGDLRSVLAGRPAAVGIIDGEFFQRLAISPKEILPLLDAGIPVLGAASMGALRAVELAAHGMIGVGAVYRLYASGALEAEDEVAVTYDPATYEPRSEAMVNLRVALGLAEERGLLEGAERRHLEEAMRRTYFPQRSVERLLAMARTFVPEERCRALAGLLASDEWNIKRKDALLLLAELRVLS